MRIAKILSVGLTENGAPSVTAECFTGFLWWRKETVTTFVNVGEARHRHYWQEYAGASPFRWTSRETRREARYGIGQKLSIAFSSWANDDGTHPQMPREILSLLEGHDGTC